MSVDYDDFLDEVIASPPDTWVCAHDGMPFIVDTSSTDKVQHPSFELDMGSSAHSDAAGAGSGATPVNSFEVPTLVD